MNQTTQTDHPIHALLSARWSPVGFSGRPVEPWKLASLFEAARWAPSSFNEQPWNFVVGIRESPEEYGRVLSCLNERNQAWAKTAPVVMITVAKLQFDRDGRPNRHAFHDIGLAMANLSVQATSMGLFVHQMGGILPDRAREVLGIPEGYEAVTGVAIGYKADPEGLPPELKEQEARPRTRKPASDFVFQGEWNHSAGFLRGPVEAGGA